MNNLQEMNDLGFRLSLFACFAPISLLTPENRTKADFSCGFGLSVSCILRRDQKIDSPDADEHLQGKYAATARTHTRHFAPTKDQGSAIAAAALRNSPNGST
jgi:hypothetical protein